MSRKLKQGEYFLKFLLDHRTSKSESKQLLLNISDLHLNILSEIFYNILRNQDIFSPKSKKLITKKKRFLNKFLILAKRKNKINFRRFFKRNLKTIYLFLNTFKKIIFQFLNEV